MELCSGRGVAAMAAALLWLIPVAPVPAGADPFRAEVPDAVLGTVVLPVPPPPRVLTPFRPPDHPWGPGHRGVDLGASPGIPVRAAAAGVVAFAGDVAGRPVVSVRHTATLRTTYEPVLPAVTAGISVAAGQVIGTLQPGHPSCAPAGCLHWGARVGADHYLDPLSLLTGMRVRLKPWE